MSNLQVPTTAQPHLYLIGIGGVGMVWIADWALEHGWRVSGSDSEESKSTDRLSQRGAQIHYGAHPEIIPDDITEVVINSAITPTSPSYPELQEVERRELPCFKRAVWVGRLTHQMYTIAVAGTHGKTTTTAMIGWILSEAGLDPTVFVGGVLAAWHSTTKIGHTPYLVLEADEFDRSFHQFQAKIAVLLNIDVDHTDYYTGGLPEIEHAFRRFLRNLPIRQGMVVGYGRDGRVRKISKGFKYRFRWYDEAHLWPGLRLQLPGNHNLLNATAAARVAHELGVSHKIILQALRTFPGVARRFERVGVWQAVEVYDDYAHHPQEIKATLQALTERFPTERKVVVFQPHQKARTQSLLAEFGRCFDQSPPDELILAPIYQVAGRETDSAVTSADIQTKIAVHPPKGLHVQVAQSNAELQTLVIKAAQQPGVLMVMGAGNIRNQLDQWMTL